MLINWQILKRYWKKDLSRNLQQENPKIMENDNNYLWKVLLKNDDGTLIYDDLYIKNDNFTLTKYISIKDLIKEIG